MSEYIMLFRFSEKGAAQIKDSPNRLQNAKKLFEAKGAKIKTFYAVLGRYDTVAIVEAPNDETIAQISLQISSLGFVHTETLPAFSEEQYVSIVNKV